MNQFCFSKTSNSIEKTEGALKNSLQVYSPIKIINVM